MIPKLVTGGFRVIAPDLIGFGKSDKLMATSDYTYQKHLGWMTQFIVALDLSAIVLFCQDWGGLIGLRLLSEMEDRFAMVIASNTSLPAGTRPMPESFLKWQAYSQHSESFDIGKVIDRGTARPLSDEVIRAYNAPFPSEEFKAGARIFPMLVPSSSEDPEAVKNRGAWEKLKRWEKNQEIASQLYITLNTVKGHARNIYAKLSVKSRTQAVAKGKVLGILSST